MDCSPPGSSVHRVSQARKLEWVAISFSKGFSRPRDWTHVSCIAGEFFTTEPPGKPTRNRKWSVKVTQSCPILGDPTDYTVRGILQARIQEWVAFPFSRGSPQPRDRTQVPHTAGRFFTSWATREAHKKHRPPSNTLVNEMKGATCIRGWLEMQVWEQGCLLSNPDSTTSQLCDLGPWSRQSLCTSVSQSIK